ncbi:uncharacterized protein LOC122382435 [Amphibalanus amphitrite]|uniref:uncharacterized protein LOC122382435 n=1 Tax=Amphibalanus amphitrite TaxID=1232801 RepID=UPI001C9247E9|nr:uncharacterized protein LOC122382435 [Amphibalanus amphitrite]
MYESGRAVDISEVMKHELTSVPSSIALADGTLRTGQKSQLVTCLTKGVECPSAIRDQQHTGVVIDAMGLVQAIGKPPGAKTFGDIAKVFDTSLRNIQEKHSAQRLDIVFDRYDADSIKSAARERRKNGCVRSYEDNDGVSEGGLTQATTLPTQEWRCYLSVSSNKTSLTSFLAAAVLRESYEFTVVVAGAFECAEDVRSNKPDMNLSSMRAIHEEADTRLLLHVANMRQQTVIVYSRDTDVLVLLTYHREKLPAKQLWMRTGSNRDQKYIPIHDVVESLPTTVLKGLLAFHAFTGSDTTSFFFRKGKRSAWKTFFRHPVLLHGIGQGSDEPSSKVEKNVETFVTRWYGMSGGITSVNEVRATLFQQGKHVATLPPTADALRLHLRRCHHQAAIWEQALRLRPALPPRDGGWRMVDGSLMPVLCSLPPEPTCLSNDIRCACSKACAKRCSCTKAGVPCAAGCKCRCRYT